MRMRPSQRARRRCRSSKFASCPTVTAATGVGDERGQPQSVRVGEPQLVSYTSSGCGRSLRDASNPRHGGDEDVAYGD